MVGYGYADTGIFIVPDGKRIIQIVFIADFNNVRRPGTRRELAPVRLILFRKYVADIFPLHHIGRLDNGNTSYPVFFAETTVIFGCISVEITVVAANNARIGKHGIEHGIGVSCPLRTVTPRKHQCHRRRKSYR